jgi:hypothetical protein
MTETVSLRAYVDLIDAKNERYSDMVDRKNGEALDAALAAVAKENAKTEVAAEKRFELLNELRGDVATKAMMEALEKVVVDLKTRLDNTYGRDAGKAQQWQMIFGIAGFATAIVALASRFL